MGNRRIARHSRSSTRRPRPPPKPPDRPPLPPFFSGFPLSPSISIIWARKIPITLNFNFVQEVYTLTVGYHELTGAKVPLKKPLLVLKKTKHSESHNQIVDASSSSRVELHVIGIIRYRILFKTRPKALISS
jgi:hypothetical protein